MPSKAARKLPSKADTIAKQPSIPAQFWPVLAGCRFALALWVLFDHTYNFGPAEKAIPVLTKSGLMAVMCFFVISGFSIHHSIQTKPQGYLRRRFWRIFPINALAVLIGWTAWSVFGISGGYGTPPTPPTPVDFLGCLFLLEVLVPVMVPFLYPAWSLSVEALYYCCAPLLQRRQRNYIPWLMGASCLFFIAWPFLRDEYIAARFSYEFAAMGLAWTWLAGWIAYQYPQHRIYLSLLMLGGMVSLWSQAKYFAIEDAVSALGNIVPWIAMLLVVFFRAGRVRGKAALLLNYLGELSYPLYLLHYPVLFVLTSTVLKTHPQFNGGIVHVAVSLAVAAVAYHVVDKPLRRRFSASSAGLDANSTQLS